MFFSKAREGDNHIVMYIITILVVLVAHIIGQMPVFIALMLGLKSQGLEQDEIAEKVSEFNENPNFEDFGVDSNLGFFLLLLGFVSSLIVLYLMVKKVHKKNFNDVIKPSRTIRWSKILYAFVLWMVLTSIFELILYVAGWNEYIFQFDLAKFIPLLLIALIVLPLQTSFEEIFFRGYLLQGLSILSKNKWVPILLTSLAFGLMHSANPEVSKYGFWNMQFYYVSVGLFLAIITVMDDSLELALGIHAATNIYSSTFVGYQGSAIQTASIFSSTTLDTTIMNIGFIAIAIIFYLIVSKKYAFPSIKYLNEQLHFENQVISENE